MPNDGFCLKANALLTNWYFLFFHEIINVRLTFVRLTSPLYYSQIGDIEQNKRAFDTFQLIKWLNISTSAAGFRLRPGAAPGLIRKPASWIHCELIHSEFLGNDSKR